MLSYAVHCDAGSVTRDAELEIAREGRREAWRVTVRDGICRLDGVEQAAVAGLVDLDLAFTPATNLIPLRRLAFPLGEEVAAPAAWLAWREKRLTPLEQFYTRFSDDTFRYRAPALCYEAELRIDPAGFLTDYPGLWQRVHPHA